MLHFYSRTYGGKSNKVIFFLVGWKGTIREYSLISRLLQFSGYRCITYAYDADMLSPNIEGTLHNFTELKGVVLGQIETLKEEGVKTFYIFGNSLGAVLAPMIANSSKDISKVVLNLIGADLAESVWSWDNIKRVAYFKKELIKNNITLEKLKADWGSLATIHNVSNFQGKEILAYISEQDELIPFALATRVADTLRSRYGAKVIINRHMNHGLSLMFNLINFRIYLDFLSS